jgi:hypothetical protein
MWCWPSDARAGRHDIIAGAVTIAWLWDVASLVGGAAG